MQKQRIKYSFIKILTGSDLSIRRLAIMEAKSHHDGPVIWLTGCIHGDEVGGIVIIQEIFKRLKRHPLLRGEIHAMPLMNPLGFELAARDITLSEEDLNRSFPGDAKGSFAERIADKIFNTILNTSADLVIDLHNDWLQSIPYTLLDPIRLIKNKEVFEKTKHYSLQTGFLVINEQEYGEGAEELKKTLTVNLMNHGVPALTLEVGGAMMVSSIFNEKHIEDGVNSVWKILFNLGMVEKIDERFNYIIPDKFKRKILNYSHQPLTSKSGIIRFIARPGDLVRKGDPVARVYNVFGKIQETINAQADGIILGHTDYSIAYPGAEIVAFALI